jgi:hypothetical protein
MIQAHAQKLQSLAKQFSDEDLFSSIFVIHREGDTWSPVNTIQDPSIPRAMLICSGAIHALGHKAFTQSGNRMILDFDTKRIILAPINQDFLFGVIEDNNPNLGMVLTTFGELVRHLQQALDTTLSEEGADT